MTSFDAGQTLADRFRRHAGTSTHLYGHAMRGMAQDWEGGGPVRDVCAGYEDAPRGSVVQLRLLAAVFRLVLTDRAPELVRFYPCLGGQDPPDQAWPVLRTVVAAHVPELHAALATAPQTNEVGRSAALLAGLLDLAAANGHPRVRLLELGASAGLNLLVDAYGFSGPGWRWGEPNSPVQLVHAIEGPVRPVPLQVVGRRGCDLDPVDPTTAEGRLLLTSFVWPFDLARHRRLAAALTVARDRAPVVDRAGAADWLPGQLSASRQDDALPVVWQSITRMYWPADEIARVEQQLAEHGSRHPLAHVSMEYASTETPAPPEVRTRLWRPGTAEPLRSRRLGTAHDHGVPVRLDPR